MMDFCECVYALLEMWKRRELERDEVHNGIIELAFRLHADDAAVQWALDITAECMCNFFYRR